MADDKRYGSISVSGHSHDVTWHTISSEVFVYCRNWWYAGKASSFSEALDTAESYLRSQGWD